MITANYLKLTNAGLKYYDWQSKKGKHTICDVTRNIKPYLFYDCCFDGNVNFRDILNLIDINTHIFSSMFYYDLSFLSTPKKLIDYKSDVEFITFAWNIINVNDRVEVMPSLYSNKGEYLIYDDILDILDCPVIMNTDFIIRERETNAENISLYLGGLQFSLFDIIKLTIEETNI